MEPILFVLCVYLVFALALSREGLRSWRDARRRKIVQRLSVELPGKSIDEALARFGEPFGVFAGSDRTLYEWKSPPSTRFPGGSGLLIFYCVISEARIITHASWQTRGENNWRSGAKSTDPLL
ncbi:MAG: hypothetical protein H7Y20_10820 [Bryobacteraceae bacterium]|nr:hypothetical protein [Bryobacteraceae bacterium]